MNDKSGSMHDDTFMDNEDDDELVEFKHFEAHLTAESVAHLRHLLGKSIKQMHSRTTSNGDGETILSSTLEIEVDAGHLVIDIDPMKTDMEYFYFNQLSAVFTLSNKDTESIEGRIPGIGKPFTTISVGTDSPIFKIEIYEGHLEDELQEHPESASFDQIIVFYHADGKWFAVSAQPGDEDLALEVLQDEGRLRSILQGEDPNYAPSERRLTIENPTYPE